MNTGKYIFAQLIEFLPQRIFDRIVMLFWHFYHDSAAIVIVGVDSQFAAQVFGMSAGQW